MDKLIDHLLATKIVEPDPYETYKNGDFHWKNTISFIGEKEAKKAYDAGKLEMKEARNLGKGLGLAMAYGGNEYTVQKFYPQFSKDKSKSMVANYFKTNKVLYKHLKENEDRMRECGYVKTIFGREIPIEGWNASPYGKSWYTYNQAEKEASNYPIQGSGGEIVRIMVVRGNEWAEKGHLYKLMHNNGINRYTHRIVTFPNKDLNELAALLEEQPTGHTKILIVDGDEVLNEYNRDIAFSPAVFQEYDYEILL